MFLNVSLHVSEVVLVDTALPEFVSTFIFLQSISFGTWQGTRWGEDMYLLISQGAPNYKVHNVILNLLLGAQTFVYQKIYFFQPCNVETNFKLRCPMILDSIIDSLLLLTSAYFKLLPFLWSFFLDSRNGRKNVKNNSWNPKIFALVFHESKISSIPAKVSHIFDGVLCPPLIPYFNGDHLNTQSVQFKNGHQNSSELLHVGNHYGK